MEPDLLRAELKFKAIRSSGSGGQNVNKVSSKIELAFDLKNSSALTDEEKELLKHAIGNRLNKNEMLVLQCDESRSQHKNKEIAIERFFQLIEGGLVVPIERKPTKVPKSAIKKRLKSKRKTAERKASRKPPEID